MDCKLLTEAECICDTVIATADVLRQRLKVFFVVYFWLLNWKTHFFGGQFCLKFFCVLQSKCMAGWYITCNSCYMAIVKWPFSQFFSLYEGHEAKFFGCGDDSAQGFPFLAPSGLYSQPRVLVSSEVYDVVTLTNTWGDPKKPDWLRGALPNRSWMFPR